MTDGTLIGITFFVYLAAMFMTGWYAFRRTRDLADFILGGRRIGSWVAALSAGASDMSGWLLLGLPGYAYASGFESFWLALGLLAGTYLNWRILAARLRVYSETAANALTLPAFFAHRFRDRSGLLQITSALFILVFFLFYTSSGLVAGGKLFEAVFGIPYVWAVGAGALAVILYTTAGGFLAVSWTDLVQALLMAAVLAIVPVMSITAQGGLDAMLVSMQQTNPQLLDLWSSADGASITVLGIVSLLGWGLGYFGQPHILARFAAIESVEKVPHARRIGVTWAAIGLTGAMFAGFSALGYLATPLTGADTEKVFILLVTSLFNPLVAGICLAAILAAIMSTADSQLLVASSALTEDLYKVLFRKQAGPQELMGIGRVTVVLIAVLAFLLALDPERMVLDLVAYAWAGFGAAFGPALILSLHWKRMTAKGALAGILSGGLTVAVWKELQGGVFDLYEIVPGFGISFVLILIVSLLDKAPDPEISREFDNVNLQVEKQ